MSYIKNTLLPDETVKKLAQLHWIVFVKPLVSAVVATLTFSFPAIGHSPAKFQFTLIMNFLWWGSIAILYAYAVCISTELAVTTHRVIAKEGFISPYVIEPALNNVESVVFRQSLLGRVLNYGTIIVRDSGNGAIQELLSGYGPMIVRGSGGVEAQIKNVSNPLGFRRAVMTTIAANGARPSV